MIGRFAVAALLLLAAARPASSRPASALDRAKQHYTDGSRAFSQARYEAAVLEFEAAYDAQPDAALLYNIAQSHRLAGHLEQALSFFRNYLRLVPDSAERAEVERTIADLQREIDRLAQPPTVIIRPAERAALTEPPPQGAPPAAKAPPLDEKKSSPLVGAGVGLLAGGIVIGLGGGISFGFAARAKANAIQDEVGAMARFDPALDDARRLFSEVAIACYAVGGVLALGGAILLGVGLRRGADATKSAWRLRPIVGPTAVGAALGGDF